MTTTTPTAQDAPVRGGAEEKPPTDGPTCQPERGRLRDFAKDDADSATSYSLLPDEAREPVN
jgi:hypothetical protein